MMAMNGTSASRPSVTGAMTGSVPGLALSSPPDTSRLPRSCLTGVLEQHRGDAHPKPTPDRDECAFGDRLAAHPEMHGCCRDFGGQIEQLAWLETLERFERYHD